MKKMWNLIKLDIITMNGGKNNMRFSLVLFLLVWGGFGFVFSPIFGLYCPLIMGGFFVPMLFQNEVKYHSEKLHSLLPISRRDLVKARFLFVSILYTMMFVIIYLIMLLALHLKLSYQIIGDEAEMMDIIGLIVKKSNGAFTEFGLFNLLYFGAYAFGLITSISALKKYFKDSESINFSLSFGKKKTNKNELVLAGIILVFLVFWLLVISGLLPIGTAIWPLIQLFTHLAQAANGVLLGAVMITLSLFMAIYKYIGAMLEYDEKEL